MIRAGPVGKKLADYGEVEWDEKGRTMISHIYISFSQGLITSIQFGYLEKGALVLSKKFGSSEGRDFQVVVLKQDEYVTGLSGAVVSSRGINNLTFHTNFGNHGPFGNLNGEYSYGLPLEIQTGIRDRREFGGFFGSCNGSNLSSTGVYVCPIAMSDTVVKRENV